MSEDVPPESNPPPVPVEGPEGEPRINPIVEALTAAFKPTFEQIQLTVTNLERRAVDQQKQIEDMKLQMNGAIEEKIIQVMKALGPAVQQPSGNTAQYMTPGQTSQMAPPGGIAGFMQQAIAFIMQPTGQQLLGQFMGNSNPGLITIDTNAIFEGGIQKAVRDVATKSLRVAFGGLEERVNPMGFSALDHVVVPDHV